MKISFKKLTAQEMMDRGILRYFYINFQAITVVIMLIIETLLSILGLSLYPQIKQVIVQNTYQK